MKLTRRHFLAWAGLGRARRRGLRGLWHSRGRAGHPEPGKPPGRPGARQGQLVRQPVPHLPVLRGHLGARNGGPGQEGAGQPALPHQPGKEPRPLRSRSAGPLPPRPDPRRHETGRNPRIGAVRPHRLGTGGDEHPGAAAQRPRLPLRRLSPSPAADTWGCSPPVSPTRWERST